jgi:F0F1-type ATP synthase assembly protein I
MVLVIGSSGVHRNQERRWQAKLGSYVASGIISGALLGALLGALGDVLLPGSARIGLGVITATVGAVIAFIEIIGRRVPLLEIDRETPQHWMHRGAFRGAVLNGAAIGSGFATRIGFWLWYLVPCAALLTGSVWRGVAVYSAYATARVGASAVLLLAAHRSQSFGIIARRILAYGPLARRVAAWQLLCSSAIVLIYFNV